jgi:hypothetical protein
MQHGPEPSPDGASTRNEAVRASAWLQLLVELTTDVEDWLAWKGYDSALSGTGDVDSVAPEEAWPQVTDIFVGWARSHGLGPVVICPHAPGLLHMIALPNRDELYYELDVNRRKVFLGSTLFRPADLLPMSYLDAHGVRSLRPGAVGVLKLIQNGMRRGARVRWAEIDRRGIRRSLADDPAGVREVSSLFGWASGAILRGAAAVTKGRWDRAAMLAVEVHSLSRAILEPDAVAWRLRFRRHKRRCPVLRSVFEAGRRVPPEERATWLEQVVAYGGHRLIDTRIKP